MTVTAKNNFQQLMQSSFDFTAIAQKVLLVDDTGVAYTASGAGAVRIKLDGANTDVEQDTSDATNNVPMPVVILAGQGLAPIAMNSGGVSATTVRVHFTSETYTKIDAQTTAQQSIDGKLGSLGQKAMAGSAPVVIASDQSAIPASQSGTWNITNVSGTVSLPTGAATSAKQDTANTSLSSIDGKITACNTGAVVVSSSALPTGAATSAKQDTANTSLASIDTSTSSTATNTSNTAARLPTGTYVDSARNVYSSTNVTTGAWVQLIASTSAQSLLLYYNETSGEDVEIGIGAAAAEARKFLIPGGTSGEVRLTIAASSRVSVRAVSGTASTGTLIINLIA